MTSAVRPSAAQLKTKRIVNKPANPLFPMVASPRSLNLTDFERVNVLKSGSAVKQEKRLEI
jgi:hypothetical protein